METKYVMTRFDFDHPTRGWKKPRVFNTFDEAETVARRMWELDQNKYVLETWDGNEDYDGEYMERNWFNQFAGHIIARSECYGNPFPQYILVAPTRQDIVVFRAYEDDNNSMEASTIYNSNSYANVYKMILLDMANAVESYNLTSPVVKLNENEAWLYEENFTNENYYQIVDVRKYHEPIDVSKHQ